MWIKAKDEENGLWIFIFSKINNVFYIQNAK